MFVTVGNARFSATCGFASLNRRACIQTTGFDNLNFYCKLTSQANNESVDMVLKFKVLFAEFVAATHVAKVIDCEKRSSPWQAS